MRVSVYIFLLGILVQACEEVPVTLSTNTDQPGSGYSQNVLIEEYTGVRCQNCPAGAQLLEELKRIHGNRLVIVSVHGGFFAQPTNKENKLKLDNADGEELIRIFNQPQGYPSSMINRKVFSGQSSVFLGGGSWAGYVDEEKKKIPSMGINLEIQSDSALKTIDVSCELNALIIPSSNPLFLSIVLVENNIRDAQLGPAGVDTNYIHRHVMRKFISGIKGLKIVSMNLNEKRVYNFNPDYAQDWKLNDLVVVAFVHYGSPGYEVLQVVEKRVK
ncbi:MAG: Omp28-related outer membrane protein [Saprospiraceae bacterium]|nr:Omp28-related outer membrane protein [Saprospiraceae bacterium]